MNVLGKDCSRIAHCEDCFRHNNTLYLIMSFYPKTLLDEIDAAKQAQHVIEPARVRKWMI